VGKRFEAYGWHVQKVDRGDTDIDAIDKAIAAAKADPRPSLIMVHTTIGFGSPHKAGTSEAHGSPLGPDEVKAHQVSPWMGSRKAVLRSRRGQGHFSPRSSAAPPPRPNGRRPSTPGPPPTLRWPPNGRLAQKGELPADWDAAIPTFTVKDEPATRVSGGKVLAAIASKVPWFLGGDADLSCSTMTGLPGLGDFSGETGLGRNIHYGVREHAMGAIANGMAYHGGVRSFTATFFVFSDYERPPSAWRPSASCP
jgi:transketolase